MEIRIRRGRRTDYDRLAALGAWPAVDGSVRRSIRLFRKVVSDLAYDLYVADQAGDLVGMITVSYARVLGLGGQRALLEELVVRPDRRGVGIGRRLVEFVLGRARKRGAKAFRASPADEPAQKFLERVGFRPKGRLYEVNVVEK
jgi:GNAT superfamily N-acetyltransferase